MSEGLSGSRDQNSIRIELNDLLSTSSMQVLTGPHNNLRLQRYISQQLRSNQWLTPQSFTTSNTAGMNQSRVQEGPNAPGSNNQENRDYTGNTWSTFLSQNPEVNLALKFLLQYIPFFIILLIKEGYEHGTGIVILGSLGVAFWHANKTVHHEVTQQSRRNLGPLGAVSFNLVTCITFVYFLMGDSTVFKSAILWPSGNRAFSSIWGLLWHIIITDFILKLVTVLIKALFTSLPPFVVPFISRGKCYVFMELSSQLYRSLATIQPWIIYLLTSESTESNLVNLIGTLNGVILCIIYMICKGYVAYSQVSDWRAAFSKLVQRTNLGTIPTPQQLEAAGPLCPICQDDYNIPTCLQCRHIFCEGCLAVWFSKEKTCPLCRSNIAEDPQWKDGSTTFFVQWF